MVTTDTTQGVPSSYDLCEVQCEGLGKVICKGFKLTKKIKADGNEDCSNYEYCDWTLSQRTYDWEITEPRDYDWFDRRFDDQTSDKHGLTITGYAENDEGEWVAKDKFTSCIITETGREYSSGIKRTIKGNALSCVNLTKTV